jgi:hypothetical protein
VTLRLPLFAACLLAASAAAGEPVDLTDWLAPVPLAGDYKVFETSDGQTVREEVVSVESTADGFRIEKRFVNDDGDDILVEELTRPGVPRGLAPRGRDRGRSLPLARALDVRADPRDLPALQPSLHERRRSMARAAVALSAARGIASAAD